MSGRVRFGVVAAAGVALVFATGYTIAGVHPSYVGTGVSRYVMANATDPQNSTSTSYVTIPNMSVGAAVPSGQVADLIITFSGEVNSCTPIEIRAVVDGVPALPGETQLFWPDNIGAQSHGFTFFQRKVPAGSHTVAIQWHGLAACNQQFISNRSLVVTANIH